MSKSFRDISLIDLVPSSISGDEKIQAAADGAGQALSGAYQNIPLVRILSRIDELPEAVVELLGWQFHVDYWDTGLSLEQKRNLVKTSIQVHRIKGTPGAIELLLREGFGLDADVLEWWEYGGDPFYFRVSVDGGEFKAETSEIISAINSVKNTRSWMDRLIFHQITAGHTYYGSAGNVGAVENIALAIREITGDAMGAAVQRVGGAVGGIEDAVLINLNMEMTMKNVFGPAGGALGGIEGLTEMNLEMELAAKGYLMPAAGAVGAIEGLAVSK